MAISNTSWKKGICPNPGGRPAGLKEIRDQALAIARLHGLAFLEKVLLDENETTKNRLTALNTILDRGLGKPPQMVQIQEEPDNIPLEKMTSQQLRRCLDATLRDDVQEVFRSYVEAGDPAYLMSLLGGLAEKMILALNEYGELQPILHRLEICPNIEEKIKADCEIDKKERIEA